MQILFKILSWIGSCFKFGLALCKSGAFLITVAVSTGISAIAYAAYKVGSGSSYVFDLLVNAESRITTMIAYFNQFDSFAFFYHTFAVDVFLQTLFSFVSFSLLLLGFVLVDSIIAGVVTFAIFLSWRVQAKLLAAFTGGQVKT